ncbi:MAG TPA: tyrosine-type recombinase/integrase [Burkholderiaceae bacterium]|nr:tyrosine-type recombinase/integrase [Burkholderiaceae bacterium]
MISEQDLLRLSEAEVGRRVSDDASLEGWVRIATRPQRHVAVDFYYRYRSEGRLHEVRVGSWPQHTLAAIRQARDRLRSNYEPAATGSAIAPAAVGSAPSPDPTLQQVFAFWLRDAAVRRKDQGRALLRGFAKDVLPALGTQRSSRIDSSQIVALLDRVAARGAVTQANALLAELRQMFRHAVLAGWIAHDPTYGIRRVAVAPAAAGSERALSDDEIRELACALGAARLRSRVEHAVWLLLATGCRLGELCGARWEEVDLPGAVWTVPASRSRSGAPHPIHLSALSRRHLVALKELDRGSQWLFSGRGGSGAIDANAIGKQLRDRQRDARIEGRTRATRSLVLSSGEWTARTLRRTAASIMAAQGARPDVIQSCLNRSSAAALTDAQRESLHAERRDAFERLGRHLAALIEQANAQQAAPPQPQPSAAPAHGQAAGNPAPARTSDPAPRRAEHAVSAGDRPAATHRH